MQTESVRCAICGTAFDDWRQLGQHERAEHMQPGAANAETPERPVEERSDEDRRNKRFDRQHME